MGEKPTPMASEPSPPPDPQAALDAEEVVWCLQRVAPLAARKFLLKEEIADLKRRLKSAKDRLKHVQWDMDLLLAKAGKKACEAPGT